MLRAGDKIMSQAEKVVIFRFSGGPRDGQTVRSDQPQQGVNEAQTYWALTRKGLIGRRFDVPAPADLAYHRYKVTSRWEDSGEIHVTCSHVG
jgi:hypothetical protein